MESFFYLSARRRADPQALAKDSLKLMLLGEGYTPKKSHKTTADLTDEVEGEGYTAGGKALSGKKVAPKGETVALHADDVVWPDSTLEGVRYAVLVCGGGNLLACYDLGKAKSSVEGDFKIKWNASGVVVVE